jgi:hypothetical protein
MDQIRLRHQETDMNSPPRHGGVARELADAKPLMSAEKLLIYSIPIFLEMAARSLFSRLSLRSGADEPENHKSRRTPW